MPKFPGIDLSVVTILRIVCYVKRDLNFPKFTNSFLCREQISHAQIAMSTFIALTVKTSRKGELQRWKMTAKTGGHGTLVCVLPFLILVFNLNLH